MIKLFITIHNNFSLVCCYNYCDTSLPIPNFMSGKILCLELLPKRLLINLPDILIPQESVKVWGWCFVRESQINWAWSGMARHNQINSKLYIINIFKIHIWSSFLCILNLHKEWVLWYHYLLLISCCFGKSVQHCS